MACIGDAKRQSIPIPKETNLGPGCYEVDKPPTTKSSYAPFSSLQPKFCEGNSSKKPSNLIGPGSYEVAKDIGSQCFTKIENEHSIIIKINDFGSSVFRSEKPRFRESQEQTPGPGEYLGPQSGSDLGKNRRKQSTASEHPILKTLKQLNEKYEKSKEFKSLQPKKRVSASLGPGSYQIPSQFSREDFEIKGPKWDLSRQQRFKTEEKEIVTEQHQMLAVEQFRREREKARSLAPSTFFRSETVKSYFDELIYHTQSSLKAEIRQKLGYKSPEPAPGSYLAVYNQMTPQTRYQFFGSTEQRFKAQDKLEVGPGQYTIPSGFAKQQRRKHRIDKTKRSLLQNASQTPGPGSYNPASSFIEKRKPTTNIEEFGSLQARFRSSTEAESEQPLLDEMLRSTNTKFRASPQKKEPPTKLTSPMFRSCTDRDCFAGDKDRKQLPFAQYNLTQDDIGERMVKKRNYLDHLEFCLLKRPGFDSSQGRFQQVRQASELGAPALLKVMPDSNKQISQSSVFKSREGRKVFDIKSRGPPIGSYDQLLLTRKSFNARFQSRKDASASRSSHGSQGKLRTKQKSRLRQ